MQHSLHELLKDAVQSRHSTIIFGNLMLFPKLVKFHLQKWYRPLDFEDCLFESQIDGRRTTIVVNPPFDYKLDNCRQLVFSNHLSLYWPPGTRIVICHIPHSNLLQQFKTDSCDSNKVYLSHLSTNGEYWRTPQIYYNHGCSNYLEYHLAKSRQRLWNTIKPHDWIEYYYFRLLVDTENKEKQQCLVVKTTTT